MSGEAPVALVATLGTTVEPVERAMEGVTQVLVLYGRPFPGQPSNPVEQLQQLQQRAGERGIALQSWEVPDPENLEATLRICRDALRNLAERRRGMIIADFTGGTKVMSAALCHAVLTTRLGLPVALQYIGGERRGEGGRVLTESMQVRPQIDPLLEETRAAVLDHLRRFDYAGAEAVAEVLVPTGRNAFVKAAATALRLWDHFEYGRAAQGLRQGSLGSGMAAAFADDAELAVLADTLSRLQHAAQAVIEAARFLRSLDGKPAPKADELDRQRDGIVLLVADALENATRRHREGRATDAVLRCYRTVEMAVQVGLLAEGKNPWGDDKIALNEGFEVIAPKSGVSAELGMRLKELQQSRNYSFLEHGYIEVMDDKADRSLATAHDIAAALLAQAAPAHPLEKLRARVSHKV